MAKLTNDQIEYLYMYREEMEPAYKTQIYFCFKDVESGETAYDFLKQAYSSEINYDAWSGWFGWGDKRDFYLGFTDTETRNRVYQEIKQAIADYQASGGKTFFDKAKDWGKYLFIGAAAVAILILLWKRLKE